MRQSRATSDASPSATPLTQSLLLALPTELLARIISLCSSPVEIVRASAISRHFHELAKEAMSLRAEELDYELPTHPEESTLKPTHPEEGTLKGLCFVALLREANLKATLAAGEWHSLFIDGEGRLCSCGTETDAGPMILGYGEVRGVEELMTPTRLPSTLGGEHAVAVSASAFNSCAITSSGAVWSWGEGFARHENSENQSQPKRIEAFVGQRVLAVSAGYQCNLAITADGAVWSWGCVLGHLGRGGAGSAPNKIEALSGQYVVSVAVGGAHRLAVTIDGGVWSWGHGGDGRLGHGCRQCIQHRPKRIEALAGQHVVDVAAGRNFSLALTTDGSVWSWGVGLFGRLGHGSLQDQLLPKKIEALAGQRVVAVSAGSEFAFARTADGALWSWGFGDFGCVGHGVDEQHEPEPKKIEAFAGRRVVAVSAGAYHSLARTSDGVVWSWGRAGASLGHGEDEFHDQLSPKRIEVWSRQPTIA